nr:dihydrofolate reductase family protein [Microbacterium barkeri]
MAVNAAERTAMSRALELAARGPRGANPQVGAVILSPAGDVLGEGWHRGAGTPHAEVDALSKLAPDAAHGATAVVTLEPCNHTGRTGPCAVALIEAGVARVVYALDPGGALIEGWLTAQRLGRPHVTVKWAQSLDGRAAAADGSSQWITGPIARADVHRRRAEADAIAVGTGTVLADDPALTARDGDALLPHQPVPVVIGTRSTPEDAAVHRHPHPPLFFDTHDLAAVMADLHGRGIQRLFVEGGPTLASAFLAAGLADQVLAYIAPVLLGGERLALTDIGVPSIAAARRLTVDGWVPLGDDLLVVARPVEENESHNEGAA